jgi:hypothetical protein
MEQQQKRREQDRSSEKRIHLLLVAGRFPEAIDRGVWVLRCPTSRPSKSTHIHLGALGPDKQVLLLVVGIAHLPLLHQEDEALALEPAVWGKSV